MKTIANITFATTPTELPLLLTWLRASFIPMTDRTPAFSPQLAVVNPLEGDTEAAQSRSLSLQFSFENEALCAQWQQDTLSPALVKFSQRFGQAALCFVTTLNTLEI